MSLNQLHTVIRVVLICAAASAPAADLTAQANAAAPQGTAQITVYKNPSCGCCENWVEHLRHHGFAVAVKDVTDMQSVKADHGVPSALASCHTAVVEGYVIEGHVPAEVIQQLLELRPQIVGLAVPGMPIGSPGMEMEGREPRPYDIIAFTRDGGTTVFAKR